MAKRVQRGRPRVYKGKGLVKVQGYLRNYGLSGARRELEADMGLLISLPTLKRIANEAGITFQRGRREAS